MAPEQLRGADPDFRADLFAFGVTLYELATGRHPFVGDDPVTTLVRVLEAQPAPSDALESCPSGLQQIVKRCLEKDPRARYDDTTDRFTSRVYPSELRTQRHKTAPWVRAADWTFALVLLGAAVATLSQTAVAATVLVGTAIATLVSSLVIEPATARAAFPRADAP